MNKTLEELKQESKQFLGGIETKEVNGKTIFCTKVAKGIKMHSLGYFESEYKAVEAFVNYLRANKRI